MSDDYKPGQRRLSDVARELALKNARVVASVAASVSPNEREVLENISAQRTDESIVQKELLSVMVTKNAPRIDEGARIILSDARALSDEIDVACLGLEKALEKWTTVSKAAIKNLRDYRMAINSEVNQTAQAVKDATGFLTELNKGDTFATLARFSDAGRALREAYGDTGLVRLADALLVISESKPTAHA